VIVEQEMPANKKHTAVVPMRVNLPRRDNEPFKRGDGGWFELFVCIREVDPGRGTKFARGCEHNLYAARDFRMMHRPALNAQPAFQRVDRGFFQEWTCHTLMPIRLASAPPARLLRSPPRRSARPDRTNNREGLAWFESSSRDGATTTTTLARRGNCEMLRSLWLRDFITTLRVTAGLFVPRALIFEDKTAKSGEFALFIQILEERQECLS
jgi:hypothetical protein